MDIKALITEMFQLFDPNVEPDRDITKMNKDYLYVRLEIYWRAVNEYYDMVDELGWDLVMVDFIGPSFNHPAPEIRKKALEMTVGLYTKMGKPILDLFSDIQRTLKQITVRTVYTEFEKVDKKYGPPKDPRRNDLQRQSLGQIKEEQAFRETTPNGSRLKN